MAKKSVTVRVEAEADRLARACAGMAGMSKPEWIARAIRRAAEADYPEVVARLAAHPQQPRRKGGRREE